MIPKCYSCGKTMERVEYSARFTDGITQATTVLCKNCWDDVYRISVRALMRDYDDPDQ